MLPLILCDLWCEQCDQYNAKHNNNVYYDLVLFIYLCIIYLFIYLFIEIEGDYEFGLPICRVKNIRVPVYASR